MRALTFVVALVLSGCNCSSTVNPDTPDGGGRSDEVRLTAIPFCTTPMPVDEPEKLLVLVDVSGSMCVSDPTASGAGVCQGLSSATMSRRLAVLSALVDRVNASPNGRLAVVAFGGSTAMVFPQGVGGPYFSRPPSTLKAQLAATLTTLSGPSDLETGLAAARSVVSSDAQQQRLTDPALLGRSSYRVVIITDGPPTPRCSANDALDGGASPDMPDGTWADTSSVCNDAMGFAGGDHNQTAKLLSLVDELKGSAAGARSVRVDTALVFNDAAVMTCGVLCQDAFGSYPGIAANQQYEAAKRDARYVLGRLAERGGGTLRDFDTTTMNDPLADVTFSARTRSTSLVQLIAWPVRSVAGASAPLADSDGDGLADVREVELGTQPLLADSDSDCFGDGFEAQRAMDGFNPLVRDNARGCDAMAMPACSCLDSDGDGLTQFEERALGTSTALPDSDFDGVPDGLEARGGMSPLAKQPARDGDGDGAPDVDEVLATSDPASAGDALFRARYAVTPRLAEESRQGNQVCWNLSVDGLSVVTVKTASGEAAGYNLVKVLLAEGLAKDDVTSWKGDCIWLKREAGSGVPTVQLRSNDFRALGLVNDTGCDGTAP